MKADKMTLKRKEENEKELTGEEDMKEVELNLGIVKVRKGKKKVYKRKPARFV